MTVPDDETGLPLLGLALTRRPPTGCLPLLVALHEWCLPATLDPALGRPTAVLATTEGLHLLPRGVPVALWAGPDDVGTDAFAEAVLIVSDDDAVVAAAGHRGLPAPSGRHLGQRRPMSPFVRARLRHARELPADAVLEQRDGDWLFGSPGEVAVIGEDVVESALGAAAAVVVTDPAWLMRALAWAAPVVTTSAAAEAVGAAVPEEVLTATTATERHLLVSELTRDEARASTLSWHGYRRAERSDADRAALTLVDRLRLVPDTPPRPAPPLPTIEVALRVLGTPADAHVRTRLAEAGDALRTAG